MPAEQWEQPPRRSALPVVGMLLAVVVVAALLRGAPAEGDAAPVEARPDPPPSLPEPQPGDPALEDPADGGSPPEGAGRWQAMPPAPISARDGAFALPYGQGMLVWGGRGADGALLADGAVYRADMDGWYTLPSAPVPLADAGGAGLWTRRCSVEPCPGSVVVLGDDEDGRPVAMRVDIGRAGIAWRTVAAPPEGPWVWRTAAWNRRHLVVLADATRDAGSRAVGYDPRADRWEELPAPPVEGWSGSRTLAVGSVVHATGLLPGLTSVGVATFDGEAWTPASPAPITGYWRPELLPSPSGGPLIVAGGHLSNQPRAFVWTRPDGWEELPPIPGANLRNAQHLARTGGRIIAWTGDDPRHGIVLARPDADAWQPMRAAPLSGRHDAAVAWTGSRLVVWGGRGEGGVLGDGAVYRLP